MYYRNYNNGSNFVWLGIMIFMFFGGFKTIFLLLPLIVSFLPILVILFVVARILKAIGFNHKLGKHINFGAKQRSRFVELLIHILVHAVKSDGQVDQREIQIIENFFRIHLRYNEMDMVWVKDLMGHSLKSTPSLDECCREFSQFDHQAKVILLEMVYQVIYSDQVITASEQSFIDSLIGSLGIDDVDHDRIRTHYVHDGADHDDYYSILGVDSSASKTDIRSAYKEACKKYHPDKVQHLGDEFKQVAEEKIKKINEAYSVLSK